MEEAFGYARVSTLKQAKEGEGIEGQIAEIKKYAERFGYDIVNIYIDNGISGAAAEEDDDSMDRPAFYEMLSNTTEIKNIIIYSTSRLWRNDVSSYIINKAFRKAGVKVYSVTQEGLDLNSEDPTSKVMRGIFTLFDEYERSVIIQRMKMGEKVKAKKGSKPSGITPLGYKYSSDKKHIVIDTANAKLVEMIFQKFSVCKLYAYVAEYMNKSGYRTRRNREFTADGIRDIILNNFYSGILKYGEIEGDGNHELIISPELWDRCQVIAHSFQRSFNRQDTVEAAE